MHMHEFQHFVALDARVGTPNSHGVWPCTACVCPPCTTRVRHTSRCQPALPGPSPLRLCRQSNCFKGDFKAANTSLLGKNDYKKVREKLLEEYPQLTKKSLERVFSTKQEINVLKCSNGTTLYVSGEKPPSFFDDGFGNLYPTLFTLWKIPNMMEELVTHGPVSKFLLPRERSAGADMMLPGVIVPESGLGPMHVGQKRCMRVEGNDMPFAVGKMLVSDADVAAKGMKGKGMAVLHVYNDSLWAYGGRKVAALRPRPDPEPNPGPNPDPDPSPYPYPHPCPEPDSNSNSLP